MSEMVVRENSEKGSGTDEVTFPEILGYLIERKLLVFGALIFSIIFSIVYAQQQPNIYTSTAYLAPKNPDSGSGGLSQVASRLSGVASLAGLSLPGGSDTLKIDVAVATLQSRTFFAEYLYEKILPELMAAESWDRATGELLLDYEVIDNGGVWIRESSLGSKPTVQEAYKMFSQFHLSVFSEVGSPFWSVSVSHISPTVAKDWVELTVKSLNEAVRKQDIDEAQKSIAFLQTQLSSTKLVNLNEIFAQLIEEQTKKMMLASVSDDYVFQVIDEPVVPEIKSGPQRALICIAGTLFGLFASIFLSILAGLIGRQ